MFVVRSQITSLRQKLNNQCCNSLTNEGDFILPQLEEAGRSFFNAFNPKKHLEQSQINLESAPVRGRRKDGGEILMAIGEEGHS